MLDEVFVFLIRIYRCLSFGRRPSCRYVPTCSTYAIEAIRRYGAFRGGLLAIKRIIRCRPGLGEYSNCGYDPVP